MDVDPKPRGYVRNTYMRSAPSPPCEAVWVKLDALWPAPPQRRTVIDGLDFTGHARGMIYRWVRSSDGLWLGLVSYEVGYLDGRRDGALFLNQLVPASALSQRHDGKPLRGKRPPQPPGARSTLTRVRAGAANLTDCCSAGAARTIIWKPPRRTVPTGSSSTMLTGRSCAMITTG